MDTQTVTRPQPQIQPCRYKVGKTLGAGSYSVVKECVNIETGRYYAAKVINKRLMAGREHMVSTLFILFEETYTPHAMRHTSRYWHVWVSHFYVLLPCHVPVDSDS